MCLLVQQTTSSNFTDEFLADVFNKNQDGLGVMYAEDDKLHIFKCLPANAQEFIGFYRAHAEGKNCVWHARMQTHGDIDFDNCHPYMVTSDVWLAHNGILSTGNAADKTKSDTWHFIKNFIRPALIGNPELLTDPEWQKFVGEIIGRSNKFALVRNDGEIVVINASAGVNYENAWLSNTYAWSYYKFTNNGGYTNMYSGYGGSRSHWADGDEYYDNMYSSYGTNFNPKTTVAKGSYVNDKSDAKHELTTLTAAQVRPYVKAAFNQWSRRGVEGVEQWVFDAPHKAAALLSYWYDDVDDVFDMVEDFPETAAEWIADLFQSDSISPNLID
jgi:hypothetical protein